MTMLWVGVGTAVLGAGASIYGSNKQADAAKKAAGISQGQYGITRGDQLPYMGAGYGALSKLNTLLGINPNPNAPRISAPLTLPNPGYTPTPDGGVRPVMQMPSTQAPPSWNVPEANMGNLPLNRILTIRAQNGDRQAQAMLQRMQP